MSVKHSRDHDGVRKRGRRRSTRRRRARGIAERRDGPPGSRRGTRRSSRRQHAPRGGSGLQRAGRPSALGTNRPPRRCLVPRPRGPCTSRGSAGSAVLRKETSHDEFAVFLGSGVLAITAVELFSHPIGQGAFVSLERCQLLGVPAHVVGQGIGQRRGERLPALEPLRRKAKRGRLKASVTRRHAPRIAPQSVSTKGAWPGPHAGGWSPMLSVRVLPAQHEVPSPSLRCPSSSRRQPRLLPAKCCPRRALHRAVHAAIRFRVPGSYRECCPSRAVPFAVLPGTPDA
jgi:hypothetical protein